MEKSEVIARNLDVEMASDEEHLKKDVARLEAHGKTCLLTGSDQGGTFGQDTRDGSSLWTGHYPRDGEGQEDMAHYIEWHTGYFDKEFDRPGTDGGTKMQEFSSSPTGTSMAAGQQLSQLSSSKEERYIESTSVRLLHGMSETKTTASTVIQSSNNDASIDQRAHVKLFGTSHHASALSRSHGYNHHCNASGADVGCDWGITSRCECCTIGI